MMTYFVSVSIQESTFSTLSHIDIDYHTKDSIVSEGAVKHIFRP